MSKYVQHIYTQLQNSFQNVILQRGGRLLKSGNVKNVEFIKQQKLILASVQSENYYYSVYDVQIKYNPKSSSFTHNCSCPFGQGCKHTVAVYLKTIELLKSNKLSFEINPKDQNVSIDFFEEEHIKELAGEEQYSLASNLQTNGINKIKEIEPGKIKLNYNIKDTEYTVDFINERLSNQINTSCNCNDAENLLCIHKTVGFIELQKQYGKYGLFATHDYTPEKEHILKQVSLSIDDDYDDVIDFKFVDGKMLGQVKHKNFIHPQILDKVKELFEYNPVKSLIHEEKEIYTTGYVFVFYNDYDDESQELSFNAVIGKKAKRNDNFVGTLTITDTPLYDIEWKSLADDIDYEIVRLIDNHRFSEKNYEHLFLAEKIARYQQIFNLCKSKKLFLKHGIPYYDRSKASELVPTNASTSFVTSKIHCKVKGSFISLNFEYYIDEQRIFLNNKFDNTYFLIEQNSNLHLWNTAYDYKTFLLSKGEKEQIFPKLLWPTIWKDWLRDLANHVDIEISKNIINLTEMNVVNTQSKVFLKEEGNFLLIYPTMEYNQTDINILDKGARFFTDNNEIINRDTTLEFDLIKKLAATHQSFKEKTFQPFFYLSADKVLEKMWFIDFYELCKKENIQVFGIEKLKKIKYYPARPKVSYSFSSGTDWFDINLKLQYDDFTVTLADVRKALINKRDYVKLDNDKFALLPEEWIKRFEAALRFGKIEKENIKLKKSQFALVHEFFDKIDDVELQKELAEKKVLLSNINQIEKIRKPKTVQAKLRDYQSEGLNWLGVLYKTKLGGCLADDMGLGKTIQMLSLFAYTKGQNPEKKLTNLVVCPTSLVYNWKIEIEKFTPSLQCKIHWAGNRDTSSKDWKKYDIIITTYGTLVNDIEWIRKFKFNVATLDESQSIKNPASLRFKAACLISAKQRYVMTGTPIENNTIELYAQMHFLNPGILGSLNAFRKNFSASIEKDRDENKINSLKQLISPFIISRKKEDVAKDLPEKTEQIMICEMSEEQQNVYDAFKNQIRQKIMQDIEADGINKSRFSVLEGLTKLRQICDSPGLLNSSEDYGGVSIKADELIRHITKKIRNHKALVFSQFLGMLEIIEERLKEQNIKYVKLTGSSTKRQDLVDSFENDDECRVFLISLKAGGFGLNLVSADYVFLVDPWWNPAVENQAIDRVHRIGQTKKVFAYRMICQNTIEEKILELQKKKKTLADDIISNENSFVSKLNKKDLEELLS